MTKQFNLPMLTMKYGDFTKFDLSLKYLEIKADNNYLSNFLNFDLLSNFALKMCLKVKNRM